MYRLDLPVDLKESAAVERRKNMEQQRQSRIFNAKVRTIGVDLDAVQQQVKDKKQQDDYERRRHEAFAADTIRNDKIAMLLQQRQNADVHELNQALNDFRSLHQQTSSRREFDLYDPDALKKDKAARVHDDDPRCGVSGIQKFEGEDLNNKARTKFQQEQLREWSEQQMNEKEDAKRKQKQADHLYELKMRELDQRAMDLQNAEDQCRKAINQSVKDYNRSLDDEQKEKQRLARKQDEDDNATEMANHVYGDILTENPAVAQSAFGPHRVIADRWKGMSPAEVDAIRNAQDLQRKEKERLQQEEDRRNKEWDRQNSANARAGLLIEREMTRKRDDINRQTAEENARLAQEQTAHRDFLEKEVYTNQPTAAYFMQFNTSSR